MSGVDEQHGDRRLLVFNCHESWVYQLGCLGLPMDIVVGLPGRYTRTWDLRMRPVPRASRLIGIQEALDAPEPYSCIITHNLQDLLDVKTRPEPRLFMLHLSLEARWVEENAGADLCQFKDMVRTYLTLTGAHAVAVTAFKGQSWGLPCEVVNSGVDADDFGPHTGELPCGLRVCNFIHKRRQFTLWDFHQEAFDGLPIRIVGHNPTIPGALPSKDWNHLRSLLRTHRFFIHTADPALEDGFNMATLEAMAAGLPVLGNRHPTSPVEHGVSGFLCDDPKELRHCAQVLLADPDLAHRMGQAARRTVLERFPLRKFKQGMLRVIETARRKTIMARHTSPRMACESAS